MKKLQNENGIALVTALMFTLIALGMSMILMYYVTAGTQMTAAQKRYRNSIEAAYGGTQFVTKTIIPNLFTPTPQTGIDFLNSTFATALQLSLGDNLTMKMQTDGGQWTSGVNNSLDPTDQTDMTFTLMGTAGSGNNYQVVSKIVDTIPGTGCPGFNSNCPAAPPAGDDFSAATSGLSQPSGVMTAGAGGNGSGSVSDGATLVPPRTPYIYAIEVQAKSTAPNKKEKAALSVLYAY
ncbi:MAG: hypothetical protein FWD70_05695 [Desulfuromonadales bacterium]|nr:hypothetical protein [Desulfuromonadales bacterium]